MMIKVRSAIPEDAITIQHFQLAMAWETEQLELNSQEVAKGVKAVFSNPEKGNYFVAEANGNLIASLMITAEWSDWRNKWVWWIQSVYVVPEHRGMKVFKIMYNHIKSLVLQNKDIAGLRLYVDLSNNNARKVYQALGMNGEHYKVFEWMKE